MSGSTWNADWHGPYLAEKDLCFLKGVASALMKEIVSLMTACYHVQATSRGNCVVERPWRGGSRYLQ